MADFVVGNDPSLLNAEDTILLLLAHQNNFNSLEQVFLAHLMPAVANGENSCLVDHVSKVGTYGAARCKSYGIEIDGIVHKDVFCMNFKYSDSTFQVRPVDNNAPVKATGTEQSRVKYLRPVRCSKDKKSLSRIKTVHFREKLIECLFPLVIASEPSAVTRLTDGINLIDEDNTRRIFFRLFKQVSDTACTYADKHFDELGTGQ